MASCEINIKPSYQGMNEVVPPDVQSKRCFECQVCWCDCIEIERDDGSRICYYSFHFNGVDQWLGECGVLQRGIVEAIYVVPD